MSAVLAADEVGVRYLLIIFFSLQIFSPQSRAIVDSKSSQFRRNFQTILEQPSIQKKAQAIRSLMARPGETIGAQQVAQLIEHAKRFGFRSEPEQRDFFEAAKLAVQDSRQAGSLIAQIESQL